MESTKANTVGIVKNSPSVRIYNSKDLVILLQDYYFFHKMERVE